MTDDPRRIWTYPKGEWQPNHWWHYFLPQIFKGGSEWGQHTIVQRVPFVGWVVVAWWMCRCEECKDSRRRTMSDALEYPND